MTLQRSDKILIDGNMFPLYCEPLDVFLSKLKPRIRLRAFKTNCYRGYVARWEVLDGKLFLLELDTSEQNRELITKLKSLLFNDEEKALADWYSGYLICPSGQMLTINSIASSTQNSDYLVTQIQDGSVVESFFLSNEELSCWSAEKGVSVSSIYLPW